jgi:nucleotide-binding universal stress UspA family protein
VFEKQEARRILLALFADECPQATLFRAQSLSLLLEAELHVLRVVPPVAPRRRILRPRVGSAEARRALMGLLEARRGTRLFLSDVLGSRLPNGRLKLTAGDFFEEVGERAKHLSASLIVLSPQGAHARHGRQVTRLVRSINVPVLVAREAGTRELIVAATDLRSQAVPVLHRAAEFSQRLGIPLIAVHNLNPGLLVAGPEMAVQLTLQPDSPVSGQRRQRLLDAARGLSVESEAVLRNELDPAQAILDEARARDADLIVVGTRGRTWFERLLTSSVSAQIISRATRSVLVTPVMA